MTDSAKQDAPKASGEPASGEPASAEPASTEPPAAAHAGVAQADAEAAGVHAEDNGEKPDLDEVKRQFREALDRKREKHGNGSGQGGRDAGKIHGSQSPATSRRSFRRKSG